MPGGPGGCRLRPLVRYGALRRPRAVPQRRVEPSDQLADATAAVLRGTDQRTGAVVASAVPELAVLRGARSVVAEDVRTLLLAAAGRPDHPVVAPSVPG